MFFCAMFTAPCFTELVWVLWTFSLIKRWFSSRCSCTNYMYCDGFFIGNFMHNLCVVNIVWFIWCGLLAELSKQDNQGMSEPCWTNKQKYPLVLIAISFSQLVLEYITHMSKILNTFCPNDSYFKFSCLPFFKKQFAADS